jgi:hypothetical protein
MGYAAFFIAFIAGNVVMWWLFLSRDKGAGGLFFGTIKSAFAGFVTMLAVLLLLLVVAQGLRLTNP